MKSTNIFIDIVSQMVLSTGAFVKVGAVSAYFDWGCGLYQMVYL